MQEDVLNLKQVTLVGFAYGSQEYLNSLFWAYSKFKEKVSFGDKKFFISEDINLSEDFLRSAQEEGISVILLKRGFTVSDYSTFMIKSLNEYVSTNFVLNFQHDGFIFNQRAWEEDFFNYDYIGAMWPLIYWKNLNGTNEETRLTVGNGGFSLRSKKLLKALSGEELINGEHPEDLFICAVYKKILEEKYNIKYAPVSVAEKFSVEAGSLTNQFGFHGKWFVSKFL